MLAVRKLVTKSSSLVSKSTTPTPPRFCFLYSFGLVLFTYPPAVKIRVFSSSTIRSSIDRTFTPPLTTLVLLSSPYFSEISDSSFLIMESIFFGLAKMSLSSLINFWTSDNSSSIFCLSRPASFCRRISKMALACNSENLNSFIKLARAISTSLDFFMSFIISSIWSSATLRPINICSRASASRRSNSVLLLTTICLCFINSSKMLLRERVCGTPLTKATKFK